MEKADFALQWLDYLGNRIYNKGKQIFIYDGHPLYEISKLKTQIEVGQKIGEEETEDVEYTRMPYSELESNHLIVMKGSKFLWKQKQRCYYYLAKKIKNSFGLAQSAYASAKLALQHDAPRRRVRLVGENVLAAEGMIPDAGIGEWVYYAPDAPVRTFIKSNTKRSIPTKEDSRRIISSQLYGRRDAKSRILYIEEVPLIMSDEKYIVCMKKEITCQRMIVVGESGQGKSLFINGVDDRIFYMWQDRLGWIIDPLDQFNDLSLPQDYEPFNRMTRWIGNTPKPAPAVQLFLACKNKLKIKHENISLVVTLDFIEFLRKYSFYTFGIKDYNVGDTIRYLPEWVNEIKDAKSGDEISDIMFEKVPNISKDKGMQAMAFKWKNTFNTIFKEKFTSNLYEGQENATDMLEVKFNDGSSLKTHPFIACMEAGLMPVLNIAAARKQRWIRNYLADLMQKIVIHQSAQDKPNRLWIVADELNEIYEAGKKKDNAFSAFEELYRQGRIINIGFIGNTQSLEKLNPEMCKNATHICCCYMKSASERRMVGKMYGLDKEIYEKIGKLKEREMMVFSNEPFIIYDRWGRRIEAKDRCWFKGKIFPPINKHYVPNKVE